MSEKLKKALEELTGAFYEEAPKNAAYPYTVFSLQSLGESEGTENYVLEINVWDQYPYYSRAEQLADKLEKKLHRGIFHTEDFLLRIYKDRRQNVPDPDKSMKRVRTQFEMKVCRKEG